MFCHLTVVVAVAIIAGINAQTQETDDSRYVQDDLADIEVFPYVVSVTNSSHKCSGSILTRQHVLTAKQCVDNDHSVYHVRWGSNFQDRDGVRIQVKYVNSSDFYDVAVITLQTPLPHDGYWAMVPLMDRNYYSQFKVNQEALVVGWGTSSESNPSGHLRRVYVKLATWRECLSKHPSLKYYEICTDGYREGRKDVCYADPGSPLLVQYDVQVGIMSSSKGCGKPDSFAAYVDIDWVRSWIDGILQHSAL